MLSNQEKNSILRTIEQKGFLNRMEYLKECNKTGITPEVTQFFDECVNVTKYLKYADQELRLTPVGRAFIEAGGYK